MFDLIAFDADDTLWHNMQLFVSTENRFKELLSKHHEPAWIEKRLFETELRNLEHFGYGIKGFTLSMIETAVELSEGRVTGDEVSRIIELGKEMLASPIELFDQTEETIRALAASRDLMMITKGDLFDQEAKLARSGLGDHFAHVEVVSQKVPDTYRSILERHGVEPASFLMIGDSLKSDVLPVLAIGGHAIHIPFEITWAHEEPEEREIEGKSYHSVASIGDVPALLAKLAQG